MTMMFDEWHVTVYVEGQTSDEETKRIHGEVDAALEACVDAMTPTGYTIDLSQ